ncbi:AAA family ATPase [Flavobacterium sp.]|uniref:AAA family ATPase n=1 Tax=Flavobacterium sp. TaxID=239 RepID=UPI00391B080C
MKIDRIKFENFRIYKGKNEINFLPHSDKNISVIAGKNGFGKTTFLTALIWVFYGKMMAEVEDKYKKDIKNAGGYENFLHSLLNSDVKSSYDLNKSGLPIFFVEIHLRDLSIPSMPCESVMIKRSYDYRTDKESVTINIDGLENELTREVGADLFINDFILPREIAKFFFFDAEKIVSLAEAKSKSELRNLSRAYSEVLGIKKYEDLKKNLETLLLKLKRDGATVLQQKKLDDLLETSHQLTALIDLNKDKQIQFEQNIQSMIKQSEALQEKLVREGNGITVEELKELNDEKKGLKEDSERIKYNLKKLLELAPIVISGKKILALRDQLELEHAKEEISTIDINSNPNLKKILFERLSDLGLTQDSEKIVAIIQEVFNAQKVDSNNAKILLDYSVEQYREFIAVIDNIRKGFNVQFQNLVREERLNRSAQFKIGSRLKQAEARKDNLIAQKLREEKGKVDSRIIQLSEEKGMLIEEFNSLEIRLATNHKILSQYQKEFDLKETDKHKYLITESVLLKINTIVRKIKEEKKYSLQKSILLGLQKIMHKNDFVHDVTVYVQDEIIDIVLLDKAGNSIDKNSLSKGEQQLYATALLKALVDESGIQFPVFIDSPLQKFDKVHSRNIISEFYPNISEQVVLLPLLGKELSEYEFELLKSNINKAFLIENKMGVSKIESLNLEALSTEIKQENYVYPN